MLKPLYWIAIRVVKVALAMALVFAFVIIEITGSELGLWSRHEMVTDYLSDGWISSITLLLPQGGTVTKIVFVGLELVVVALLLCLMAFYLLRNCQFSQKVQLGYRWVKK